MSSSQSDWFIRSRLKTRQIVLLVHLDEQRSVLRAAEAAGMTQPAASKLLGELEDALGVPLFDRHARGVEPTWYGEILVRHARSALSEIGRAHEEIAALKSGLTGQASIGTVMNPGTNLVPTAVAMLKQRHPQILVAVELDYSKTLVGRLLEGRLDIAVARILDSRTARDLTFEPLAEEPHSVIARAGHPLARKRGLRVEDLVRQAWILPPPDSILRDRLNSMFLQRGLDLPTNVVETSSLPIVTSLLRRTDMLVALPEEAVRPYCETGVLTVLPISLGVRMDSFGIITRREHRLSPGAEAVLTVLREAAAELYPRGQSPRKAGGNSRRGQRSPNIQSI